MRQNDHHKVIQSQPSLDETGRDKLDNSLTFSFSPENKSPESGGNLKLVSVSSHVSDGAGEDHTFGVHLLQERNANTLLTCKTSLHL